MQRLRRASVIILVLAVILSMSACGTSGTVQNTDNSSVSAASPVSAATTTSAPASKDKVKLKVMLLSTDSSRLEVHKNAYVPNVVKDFPNWDIEFDLPGTAYMDKLKVYISSGEMPDVFWGDDIAVQSGTALDLTPYITKDGFQDEYLTKNALLPYKDGKIYAVSCGSDAYMTSFIGYNKSIFAKVGVNAPKSFDDLLAVSKTLKNAGYVPISTLLWTLQYFAFQDLVMQDNPQAVQDLLNGKGRLTDKPFVDAATKLKTLVDNKVFPKDVAVIEYQASSDLFVQGKAAMMYCPIWQNDSIRDANKDMDWFYLTSFDKNPKYLHGWGAPLSGFCVTKTSKHVDEAVKLAEWLAKQDAQYFSSKLGNPVAIKGNTLSPDIMPVVKYTYDLFNNPSVTAVGDFATTRMTTATASEYETAVGKLITNQLSPEQFCKTIDATYSKQ